MRNTITFLLTWFGFYIFIAVIGWVATPYTLTECLHDTTTQIVGLILGWLPATYAVAK